MGRKDTARFLKIEKQVEMLKINQGKIIEAQEKILNKWQRSLIQLRDIYNKLIEGG